MPDAASTAAVLVVRVGGERWGIPVGAVIEVLRGAALARVPASDPAVAGIVNHRGRVLTVADAARALGLAAPGPPSGDIVVVEGAGGRRFAVAVDAALELIPESRTGLATMDMDAIAAAIFA